MTDMDFETVETVAKAILKARQERGISGSALWEFEPDFIRELYLHEARAAIAALNALGRVV